MSIRKVSLITVLLLTSQYVLAGWEDLLGDVVQEIEKQVNKGAKEVGDVIKDTLPTSDKSATRRKEKLPAFLENIKDHNDHTLFEHMAMQFLIANKAQLQPEISAAMYGYAVKDYNKNSRECQAIAKINNSIDASEKLAELHAEMERYLSQHANKYKNHTYTISLTPSKNGYEDYDHERSSLIISNVNSLKYSVQAQGGRDQHKFRTCRAMLDLPTKARVTKLKNKIPDTFRFEFHTDLHEMYEGPNDSVAQFNFEREKLAFVPMESSRALNYLKRDRNDRKVIINVTFEFKPLQLFYALDDPRSKTSTKKFRKKAPGYRTKTSHSVNLHRFSYVDKSTGEEIYRLDINDRGGKVTYNCKSIYDHGSSLQACPGSSNNGRQLAAKSDGSNSQSEIVNTKSTDLSKEQILKEVTEAHEQCIFDSNTKLLFDCNCIRDKFKQDLLSDAAYQKFLNRLKKPQRQRLDRTHFASYLRGNLFEDHNNQCARPKKLAEYVFKKCMEQKRAPYTLLFNKSASPSNSKLKESCKCLANVTAQNFSEDTEYISISSAPFGAIDACK